MTQTQIPVKSRKFTWPHRGLKGFTLHLAIVDKKSQDVQTRNDLALHTFCIRSHGNDRSAKKSPRSPSCPGVELANKHRLRVGRLAWVRQYSTLKESSRQRPRSAMSRKTPGKVRARTCGTKSPSRSETPFDLGDYYLPKK